MEFALNSKPLQLYVPPVRHGLSYRMWQLVNSSPFENFILFLISINTLTLMMKVNFHVIKNIIFLKSLIMYSSGIINQKK